MTFSLYDSVEQYEKMRKWKSLLSLSLSLSLKKNVESKFTFYGFFFSRKSLLSLSHFVNIIWSWNFSLWLCRTIFQKKWKSLLSLSLWLTKVCWRFWKTKKSKERSFFLLQRNATPKKHAQVIATKSSYPLCVFVLQLLCCVVIP